MKYRENWTYELVYKFLKNLGYELISKQYLNCKDKLVFIDNDGYYYISTLSDIKQGYVPNKFYVSNPYTIQNIKHWCKLNNKPFELISVQYAGSHYLLKWKCLKPTCKENFLSCWCNIVSNKGCGFCDGKQVNLLNCLETKNPDLAKEWHPTLNGDLTPFNITSNSNQSIWWQCSKNSKHIWKTTVSNRNGLNSGCPYCDGKLPTEDYNLLICNIELCKEWNYSKNKKNPEEYTPNSKKKVWWKCKKCSHEWSSIISERNRKDDKSSGCPKCNESKGEKRMSAYLDKEYINHTPQYKIKDCKNKQALPFDEAIFHDVDKTKLICLIEYDGEYHYKKSRHKNGEQKLIECQNNDKIKNKYCKENNILLIRIPYWQFDKIEEILHRRLLRLTLLNKQDIKEQIEIQKAI